MEQSTEGTEQHVVEVTPRNAERNDGVVDCKDVSGDDILNTDTSPVDDEETVRQKIGDEILVENSDYDNDTPLAVLNGQISIKRSNFYSRNEKPTEEQADITIFFRELRLLALFHLIRLKGQVESNVMIWGLIGI